MRQVAGSRDDHGANIERSRERVCELEGRPGEIAEERHQLGAEAPERHAGQSVRVREEPRDAVVEARLAVPRSDGTRRVAPLRQERLDRAARERVVGACDERRRPGPAGERPAHRISGPVGSRLADVADAGAERRAAAEQLLDLLGEVADDDRYVVAACRREVAHQRRDHGAAVDREDRLRPAHADRPHAGSLTRGHDDGAH
jgi:hypothetical protein